MVRMLSSAGCGLCKNEKNTREQEHTSSLFLYADAPRLRSAESTAGELPESSPHQTLHLLTYKPSPAESPQPPSSAL